MRLALASALLGIGLIEASAAAAQSAAPAVPPFAEVEAAWSGFWNAVSVGDVDRAATYLHSRARHHFQPQGMRLEDYQKLADQMAYCRIDPTPSLTLGDYVTYRVHCQRAGETAETQVVVRRDIDGVWRMIP